ncbi:MAG: hypothetical protein ACXAB7_08665 [Candidatus Kariarchaeaceae archaeon]|jgi:hypothetical protein
MEPLTLFDDVVYRRNVMLKAFEMVDKSFFQQSVDQAWSPESLFRHFLTGMQWQANTIEIEIESQPLSLMTGQKIEKHVDLRQVKTALDQITKELRSAIQDLPESKWREIYSTPLRKNITREHGFISLLFHELEHLGQLKWILKRLSGWTDKEIYALRIEG